MPRRSRLKKQQGPDVSLSVTSAYVNRIITAIMTAGGKVLKEEYGFSVETIGEWALKTAAQAKEYLGLKKDEGQSAIGTATDDGSSEAKTS